LSSEDGARYELRERERYWLPLERSLPWGHTLTGPFIQPLFFHSIGFVQEDYQENLRVTKNDDLLTERRRMKALRDADFVFAWIGAAKEGSRIAGFELGAAYLLGKPIILAAAAKETFEIERLLAEVAWKLVVGADPRDAYEKATADLDVTFNRGFARVASRYDGQCVHCRGSYHVGEAIYWSKQRGAYHEDCYIQAHRPEDASSVLFNTELVAALREENARLEKENTGLMVENSMLRQKAH
jgi:hypothetical protein